MSEETKPVPAEWKSLDGMARANLCGPMLNDWFRHRDKLLLAGTEWRVAREELLQYFTDDWEDRDG